MIRPGEPSIAELMAQLAANAAEIAALKAEKEALSARVVKLEEELALARLHRFAPKSEKHVDRLFNEAEQVVDEGDRDRADGEVIDLPDTGLPPAESGPGKKRGRKPLPEHLPRERVEYALADDQKACPCCRHQMHRMGEAVTEQLHIEVKAKVLQNVRFKYACRHCDRTGINTPVVLAPMPASASADIWPSTTVAAHIHLLTGKLRIRSTSTSRRHFPSRHKQRRKPLNNWHKAVQANRASSV